METTGGGRNFQFRRTRTKPTGDTETRIGRFDVNLSDPHVARQGPHLNLEIQVNGRIRSNEHIPIDSATVRPGDTP